MKYSQKLGAALVMLKCAGTVGASNIWTDEAQAKTHAMNRLLQEEGGKLVNKPEEYSRWGVTKKVYPNVDITNLTRGQAKKIYSRDYWPPGITNNLPLKAKWFDARVNLGQPRADRMMQRSLGSPVDGILGPNTREAFHNVTNQFDVMRKMQREMVKHYKDISVDNPKNKKNLKGWLQNRAGYLPGWE